jgi:hypothetical protein
MASKSNLPVPAAPRQPLAVPSDLEETSLKVIEKMLGGREGLVAALSHAPKSRDLEYLLGLIGDPANAKVPLGYLCAQGGITPGELLSAWKSGEILRGHVLATKQIVEALPGVVSDVLKRAAPYEDTCSGCGGLGQVTPEPTEKKPNPEPKPCPACGGQGRLLYEADLDRAKLALELAQLTSKGAGVAVNLDQRQVHLHGGGGSAGGALEALMAASDAVLYGEASVLPPHTPAPPLGEVIDVDPLPGADSTPATSTEGDPL